MHEESQKLVVSNNKLKNDLKWHINKLAFTQSELNDLKQENKNLVSSHKTTNYVCASTSSNMDDFKALQEEFTKFKRVYFDERMKLQMLKIYFQKIKQRKV